MLLLGNTDISHLDSISAGHASLEAAYAPLVMLLRQYSTSPGAASSIGFFLQTEALVQSYNIHIRHRRLYRRPDRGQSY